MSVCNCPLIHPWTSCQNNRRDQLNIQAAPNICAKVCPVTFCMCPLVPLSAAICLHHYRALDCCSVSTFLCTGPVATMHTYRTQIAVSRSSLPLAWSPLACSQLRSLGRHAHTCTSHNKHIT
eukprot:1156603-Pelagomonas_calceolata.AAC.7